MDCLCSHKSEQHKKEHHTICLVDDCGCPEFRPDWQKAYAALKVAVKDLKIDAEAHRIRYNDRLGNGEVSEEYWKGRRDEAGYFRDKLAALLDDEAGQPKEG